MWDVGYGMWDVRYGNEISDIILLTQLDLKTVPEAGFKPNKRA
jgi:hypothetical protein